MISYTAVHVNTNEVVMNDFVEFKWNFVDFTMYAWYKFQISNKIDQLENMDMCDMLVGM